MDGDASFSKFIVCQGKKLAITKNCEAAIRCFRRRDRKLVLWIDAICIDQKSTTERNHQVRLMAHIYSNASQVLVYLGFRNPGTMSTFLGYLDRRSQDVTGDAKMEKSVVLEFLQHPYFNRVWILQEISLAKLVVLHTDHQTIYWDARTVHELLSLCRKLNHDPPGVLHWLPATQLDEYDCLDLLHRARRCMATDSRDKVFALYGFLSLSFREALPINYAMGIEEVYWNIATYLISTTKRLEVLKHVSPYQPLDIDIIPIWVTDWDTRQFIDMELPKFTSSQMAKFAAFDSSSMSTEISMNAGTQLKSTHATQDGYQTELSSQHNPLLWYRSPKPHPTLMRVCMSGRSAIPYLRVRGYLLDKVTTHTYNVPPSDDTRHTLQKLLDPKSTPFLNSKICHFCTENPERTSCDEVSSDKHRDYQSQQLTSLRRVMTSLRGEKLAFMTQQSIGFALFTPIHDSYRPRRVRRAEPGNTIWATEGLDVPIILRRRTQDGESHYILVGQCYLHRAGLDQECPICGSSSQPWSMKHETIAIW